MLPRPNAPAASNRPFSVRVKRRALKMSFPVQDVHAVSRFSIAILVQSPSTYDRPNPCGVGARPAGECNCDRASEENTAVKGPACSCGKRPSGQKACLLAKVFPSADMLIDACTCEKASDGGLLPTETDFTTKKSGV